MKPTKKELLVRMLDYDIKMLAYADAKKQAFDAYSAVCKVQVVPGAYLENKLCAVHAENCRQALWRAVQSAGTILLDQATGELK